MHLLSIQETWGRRFNLTLTPRTADTNLTFIPRTADSSRQEGATQLRLWIYLNQKCSKPPGSFTTVSFLAVLVRIGPRASGAPEARRSGDGGGRGRARLGHAARWIGVGA